MAQVVVQVGFVKFNWIYTCFTFALLLGFTLQTLSELRPQAAARAICAAGAVSSIASAARSASEADQR